MNTLLPMLTNPALETALGLFDSASAFARAIGVSREMVRQWRHGVRPIAKERAWQIERLTDGKVKAAALNADCRERQTHA